MTATGNYILVTKTDKKRVQQIFLNLLSNALKFTPKNGHIKVLIQAIQCSADSATLQTNDFLRVTVMDSGQGIK